MDDVLDRVLGNDDDLHLQGLTTPSSYSTAKASRDGSGSDSDRQGSGIVRASRCPGFESTMILQ